ncbi:hypothetical protein L204_103282 [Cryptococcus depauperatus]
MAKGHPLSASDLATGQNIIPGTIVSGRIISLSSTINPDKDSFIFRLTFTIETSLSRSPNKYEPQSRMIDERFEIRIELYSSKWSPFGPAQTPSDQMKKALKKYMEREMGELKKLNSRATYNFETSHMKVLRVQPKEPHNRNQRLTTVVTLAGHGKMAIYENGIRKLVLLDEQGGAISRNYSTSTYASDSSTPEPHVPKNSKILLPVSDHAIPSLTGAQASKRGSTSASGSEALTKRSRTMSHAVTVSSDVNVSQSARVEHIIFVDSSTTSGKEPRENAVNETPKPPSKHIVQFGPCALSLPSIYPNGGHSATVPTLHFATNGHINDSEMLGGETQALSCSDLKTPFRSDNGFVYLPLDSLDITSQLNVIAVIAEVNEPQPPKGQSVDHQISLVLTDPSRTDEMIVLTLFRHSGQEIMGKFKEGDVLLIRKVKCVTYKDKQKLNSGSKRGHIQYPSTWILLRDGDVVIHENKNWQENEKPFCNDELRRMKDLWKWGLVQGVKDRDHGATEKSVGTYKYRKLSERRVAEYMDGIFKILKIFKRGVENFSGLAMEIYVSDGTFSISDQYDNRNYHQVNVGLPPRSVFCIGIADFDEERDLPLLRPGNIVKMSNLHCKIRSGEIEFIWANLSNENQAMYGTGNKYRNAIAELRARESARTGVTWQENPLIAYSSESTNTTEKQGGNLQDLKPNVGSILSVKSELPSPSTLTNDFRGQRGPRKQIYEASNHLRTLYRSPEYPLYDLLTISTSIQCKIYRTIAYAFALLPEDGGEEKSLIKVWCKTCQQFLNTDETCVRCEEKENLEWTYGFWVVVSDGECMYTIWCGGKEAEDFLPPLPPFKVSDNPNDVNHYNSMLSRCNEETYDILLGPTCMNGKRKKPWIDWSFAPFKGAGKEVTTRQVFAMRPAYYFGLVLGNKVLMMILGQTPTPITRLYYIRHSFLFTTTSVPSSFISMSQTETSRAMPKSSPNTPPSAATNGVRSSAPAPVMIALAGWPESVFVASKSTGNWEKKHSESATPPAVYDGVGGRNSVPQHVAMSALVLEKSQSPYRKSKFPPQNQPVRSDKNAKLTHFLSTATQLPLIGAPNLARPVRPVAATFNSCPTPSQASTSASSSNLSKNNAPATPQLSIFATTCPHLSDPSLGPCPFPTHPHDVRGMFPPTSHQDKLGEKKEAKDGPTKMDITLSKAGGKIADKSSPTPTPPFFSARPTKSVAHSVAAPAKERERGDPPASPYAFQDPRYLPSSAILHKGRVLPLVPSWSGAPSSTNKASTTLPAQSSAGGDGKKANAIHAFVKINSWDGPHTEKNRTAESRDSKEASWGKVPTHKVILSGPRKGSEKSMEVMDVDDEDNQETTKGDEGEVEQSVT